MEIMSKGEFFVQSVSRVDMSHQEVLKSNLTME